MTLDTSAYDITKEMKKKMRVLDRGSFGSMNQRPSTGFAPNRMSDAASKRSAFQNMAMRGSMGSAMGSHLGAKTLPGAEGDEREELCLYLFKTHARNKMLAFKRILPNECPLRMLPLDYLETLEEDGGFEHIVSTTTSVIDGSKYSADNYL